MAIGERIHYFRTKLNLTQKAFGKMIGFDDKSSDIRIAQYESGTRTPKADLTDAMAAAFGISPNALNVPNIDSYIGFMHTLFAIEDIYGIKIGEIDGEICLRMDKFNSSYLNLFDHFSEWNKMKSKLDAGQISQEDYDNWRYNFPQGPSK